MHESSNTSEAQVAVVFGGRSPIAVSCAKHLSLRQDTVLVTRKIDQELLDVTVERPRLSLAEADLEHEGAATFVFEKLYDAGYDVSAVIFLQRYRPTTTDSFDAHCAVEIWSIAEALETISLKKRPETRTQVVISSSPAAITVLNDQPFSYHMVKASQEALARFYGVKLARSLISVNAVRIGSIVLKPRASKYWKTIADVVTALRQWAPTGRLQNSDYVGAMLANLAASELGGFTGQTLTLDDGFGLLDSSQAVKGALEISVTEN